MINKFKNEISKQKFNPGYLGLIINPFYIIRSSLIRTISKFATKIEGNILDLGCGSKPYESIFIKSKSYVGIDILSGSHNHKDSQYDILYDGKTIPFLDHSFDAVVSFEVFEHIYDLSSILKEISRVTKPGGFLLISIPFAWNEHETPHDYARYTSYGLSKIILNAGFKVIEIEKSNSLLPAISQLLITYIWQNFTYNNFIMKVIVQFLIIFPATIVTIFLDFILPTDKSYYSNLILLGQKNI
jgi:SAM-dependent methyltransferase